MLPGHLAAPPGVIGPFVNPASELIGRALQEMVFRGGRLNVRLLGSDVTALPELSSSSAQRL